MGRDNPINPVEKIKAIYGSMDPEKAEETRQALADIFDSVLARVHNQRDSIDRMLEHLQFHCPELSISLPGNPICPYMELQRSQTAAGEVLAGEEGASDGE